MDADSVNRRGPGKDIVAACAERFGDDWLENRENDGKTQVRLKTFEEYRPLFEEPGKFLLMRAEEISDAFNPRYVHMNAVNPPEIIYPQHGESVRETIRNNMQAAIKLERETGQPVRQSTWQFGQFGR